MGACGSRWTGEDSRFGGRGRFGTEVGPGAVSVVEPGHAGAGLGPAWGPVLGAGPLRVLHRLHQPGAGRLAIPRLLVHGTRERDTYARRLRLHQVFVADDPDRRRFGDRRPVRPRHAAGDPAPQRRPADQSHRRVDRDRGVGVARDHGRPHLVRVLPGRGHPVDPAGPNRHELPGPGSDADRVSGEPVAQRRVLDARVLGGLAQPALRGARGSRGRGRIGVEAVPVGDPPAAEADDRDQPAPRDDPEPLRVHAHLRDDPGWSRHRDHDASDLRVSGGVRLPPAGLWHRHLARLGLDRRLLLAAVRARIEKPGMSVAQARPLNRDKLIVVPYRKVSTGALVTNLVLVLLGCFFLLPMLWMVFASIDSNPDWAIKVPSPTFANFANVLGRADALSSFRSSLILAGTTTVVTTVLALLSAYPLSPMHIPFKRSL